MKFDISLKNKSTGIVTRYENAEINFLIKTLSNIQAKLQKNNKQGNEIEIIHSTKKVYFETTD